MWADLVEELDTHQTEYDDMFGSQLRFEIYNSLNFFRSDIQAPYRNWLTLPETGILVASRYKYTLQSEINILLYGKLGRMQSFYRDYINIFYVDGGLKMKR